MPISLVFWILMLVWLVGGLYWRWPAGGAWGPVVPDLLAFLLFLILGWHAFGAPLRF
jgi:hypothetical protein